MSAGFGNYTKRKYNHDYQAPCIYHIILKKNPSFPLFSKVTGDARLFYHPNSPRLVYAKPTWIIDWHIRHFNDSYPQFHTYQYCIMPDHIHWLFRVEERLERKLGYYIGRFKAMICYDLREKYNLNVCSKDVFLENFTDRIIYHHIKLDTVYQYVKSDPYRLAVRFQFPEFFRRVTEFSIGGVKCELYGNLFLLNNPFKEQIQISRKATELEIRDLCDDIGRETSNGMVVVSPFISKGEKAVFETVMNGSGRMIKIKTGSFGEGKPYGKEFELCINGRLLIISLPEFGKNDFSREICQKMNNMAKEVCGFTAERRNFRAFIRLGTYSKKYGRG